ncbi:cobyrinic acid a,c-diamide synthase [Melghirimyces profundicolus]|uniref:Cobyrinate a,c-diamide synthase n=1 Tax=Melghirimyces profundicolus TaxID=1242148 RepID=A0A2T6C8H4_9BACL|nr:cobyrinate a,c-diamide synthase [Melghirimyces profundicolus]PTX64576.1 cobyrinic acid a,c-diamide synthase [Melghirimyces profundicolus]
MESNPPRLVIAGTGSGAGKTTVTSGLLAAMKKRGIRVQAFKAGPDYIDPGFHGKVTGRSSRNLDTWMLGKDGMREVFIRGARGADLCIVEGVMGLFDGKHPDGNEGSTAEIAAELNAPVVLVIDAHGAARSAAAVVRGFQVFEPAVEIGGVILNRVGSDRHVRILTASIEKECGIPVLGSLGREASLALPERHLGLVPVLEQDGWPEWLNHLSDRVTSNIDLDALLSLAERNAPVKPPAVPRFPRRLPKEEPKPVIAVARDAAFHFYYAENLELLRLFGAELRFFSPLESKDLPEETDGLYLGGGYPEELAGVLAGNTELKRAIRSRIEAGLPTYAECGGWMFLCRSLTDRQHRRYAMAGVIPADIEMTPRAAALGYREVRAEKETLLLAKGETARGHEFHYSRVSGKPDWSPAWRTEGSCGHGYEGYAEGALLAAYTHLHFLSRPEMARRWVAASLAYRMRRTSGGAGKLAVRMKS